MNLVENDLKYIWHPCSQMKDYEELKPIMIDHGQGVYLYDTNGKEYIDIISSWWCNLLGHCNPAIGQAIKSQLDQLEHVIFANFSHEPAVRLCEELSHLLPKGLAKFHFSDNGSGAVEAALKMSFQYQYQIGNLSKTKFMCLSEGYHGETLGALAVGSMDLYAKKYKPIMIETIQVEAPDCYRCPYGECRDHCEVPCFEHAEKSFERFAKQTCAIIVEPLLQGSAGMRIYPALYLKKLRELCDRYQVLLIADEIATGFGRTGKMFACEHAGISPDIMCISKGLTGGYLPMAVTIATDRIYQAFYADYNEGKAFMHSHTYSGNPLGCSAALAVLKILNEDHILDQAKIRASFLHDQLKNTFRDHPNIGEIRHIGLIHAMELVEERSTKKGYDPHLRMGYQVYKQALEYGLILRPLGNVLYFNPPLNIKEEELIKAIDRCALAIENTL